jgi:parallel beta-helix repeat protein
MVPTEYSSFGLPAVRIQQGRGASMRYVLLLIILLWASGRALSAQAPQPTPLPITQTISVSAFGARGDGQTNDTQAFIAAITVAASEGARLQLGNATYLLTATLTIPATAKPISIAGGTSTTLLFAPPHPIDSGIVVSKNSAVELKSFTIQGSGAGLNHAIFVTGSTNVRLDSLQIKNIQGTGALTTSAIILSGDNLVWITNSIFTGVGAGPGKPAFVIWNYYKTDSQNIYISHNNISGNAANISIAMFDTNHSVIQNNVIDGGNNCVNPCNNNGYGVVFYLENLHGFPPNLAPKLQDETITGNQISNTSGSGIYLASVTGATISGNSVTHSSQRMDDTTLPAAGIALNGADNVSVTNNIIQNDGRGGICLTTTKNDVIEGNQINNSPKWGIHLRVADASTTIQNNTINTAPVGILSHHDSVDSRIQNNVLIKVGQALRSYTQNDTQN